MSKIDFFFFESRKQRRVIFSGVLETRLLIGRRRCFAERRVSKKKQNKTYTRRTYESTPTRKRIVINPLENTRCLSSTNSEFAYKRRKKKKFQKIATA